MRVIMLAPGTFRVFIRGVGFEHGADYSIRLWSPALVEGEELALTEMGNSGLYYRDCELAVGAWALIAYRGGVKYAWSILRVESVASLVFDAIVEGSLTFKEMQRIKLAVLAGLASGAGTDQRRFRDVADTKNRVVATVTRDGDRTTIVLDGS